MPMISLRANIAGQTNSTGEQFVVDQPLLRLLISAYQRYSYRLKFIRPYFRMLT